MVDVPGCRPGHDPAQVTTGSRHRCQTAARRTRRSPGCARITTEAVRFRYRSDRRLGTRDPRTGRSLTASPCGQPSQSCLLNQTGNVVYHLYRTEHERTTQASRHHHPGRQASRPPHRPGHVRGRGQPGSGAGMRASSARTPPRKSSASSPSSRPPGRKRPRSRWPSSPTRSALGSAAVTQPVSGSCPLSCGGS